MDSLAFVDDQAFEREEVKNALPYVTVIDAAKYETILARPECQAVVTAESKGRRAMYRIQQQRDAVLEGYKGDYSEFLRGCRIEVSIVPLGEANLKRVYELAQRTNQMNFSGNRYQETELEDIMRSLHLETCVVHCQDRFGDYGIVGFAVVDTRVPALLDLMFSCRVQGKRVEHAIVAFLLRRFLSRGGLDFYANYRRTPRNAASGRVFEELGFEPVGEKDGVSSLIFRRTHEVPDDQIVRVVLPDAEPSDPSHPTGEQS